MTDKKPNTLQFERFVFFSDAVFAIAITLLIIDIQLPKKPLLTEQDLQQALVSLAPNYVGFLISFIVIGQFWAGHRRLFRLAKDVGGPTLFANMTLLFAIAFLPFPTAVVNAYGGTTTAVVFYGAWLLFAGLANLWLVHSIHRDEGNLVAPLGDEQRFERRRAVLPLLIATSGIVVGLIYAPAGVVAFTISPPIFAKLLAWRTREQSG
ncbi:TMEM175 family protein [Sphingomonas sp. ASV193]|uniref:TMEM175 family protein n=1 Tax=Sphingomonas sp. ASV193 TaxID=3144405 RepID=UPI0032E869B6